MKQNQVLRIINNRIDAKGMAKDLIALGFTVPTKKKIITVGGDFLTLLHNPKRIEKLTDGWFFDHFLSKIYGKDFAWSPASLEKYIPWREAEEYAKQFGMQPSDFELSTLIDRSKRNPAIIEAAKVLGLKTDDWYWSRTPLAGDPDYAWYVDFKLGSMYYYYKGSYYYVRPVRSSQ